MIDDSRHFIMLDSAGKALCSHRFISWRWRK